MVQRWEGRRLSVAIPGSLVSDTPHLREKTGKLGSIARACSVFGVTEITLYNDDLQHDQKDDLELCSEILKFIETPQYLRRRMFRLTPTLRYAGILPPLQTAPHNVPHSIRETKVGDIRDGVVVAQQGGRLIVDIGLERAFECVGEVPLGTRVTVKVANLGQNPRGEIVNGLKEGLGYWGYRVVKADSSLCRFLEKEEFDLVIGTSRYGSPIIDVWANLTTALKSAKQILVAFGSPKLGLKEILRRENKTPEHIFDYFVNTVPNQNVSTVRTEEAIQISLGIFNLATSIY
jgi:predicted SPOUT superfamily RNA methylase MTH1